MVAKLVIIFQTIDILAHIPAYSHYRYYRYYRYYEYYRHYKKRLPRRSSLFDVYLTRVFRYVPSDLSVVSMDYFVTLSSHLTIPNMIPIEMRQTAKKTVQHCQIGHALYINGPIQRRRLPSAVAPSQRPWQRP